MPNFAIISDSSCDLKPELANQKNIKLVPFSVTVDGETYYKEHIEMTTEQFFTILRSQNVSPKTSLPSAEDYATVFRASLDQGDDVLCFCITSKFSGSFQSATLAASLVKDEYPNREVIVIDSEACTMGQGFLVLEAAKMREKGFTLSETVTKINKMKSHCMIFVTVNTLEYLQKGGRIGKASALAGNIFGIKPVIVFKEGELSPFSKVRGRKKAVQEVVENLIASVKDVKKYNFFIAHGDEHAEAAELADTLSKQYGIAFEYQPINLGVTIAAHIGPTALAVGYMIKRESV